MFKNLSVANGVLGDFRKRIYQNVALEAAICQEKLRVCQSNLGGKVTLQGGFPLKPCGNDMPKGCGTALTYYFFGIFIPGNHLNPAVVE